MSSTGAMSLSSGASTTVSSTQTSSSSATASFAITSSSPVTVASSSAMTSSSTVTSHDGRSAGQTSSSPVSGRFLHSVSESSTNQDVKQNNPSRIMSDTCSPSIVIEDTDHLTSPTSLHDLYRLCYHPLQLYEETRELLQKGVPINFVDDAGCTALSLLILHVNRGLRYHQYRLSQLAKLEDKNAPRREIFQKCVELDCAYQEAVFKCLELLLKHGANTNILPATFPGIPFELEWSENYEHKLMQSDQRWNLFTCGGSMEFTTYSIFNPLTRHRPPRLKGISVLHLCAWRGDALCLDLLLKHGANVHAVTTDNRNALHFLYLYCNKPESLVECTQLLVQNGIDVNLVDKKAQNPILLLLNHFLVKWSHVKYLANSYTTENIADIPIMSDHYRNEIKQCIEILLEAGAELDLWHENLLLETPLHHIYTRFEHSLRNCEPEFQEKGHYLVPYHFKLEPLVEFSQFLIGVGNQVNALDSLGRTPLHRLVQALRNLSLSEQLNSNHALHRCFSILLAEGADVRLKDYLGRTVIHYLVETMCGTKHTLPRYLGVIKMLLCCGADLRTQDNHGNTVLHLTLGSSIRAEHLHDLLVFLLQYGADANQPNMDNKYPLNNLMREHINHHDPLSQGSINLCLRRYLRTMDTVCRTMTQETLGYIFSVYRESGFWGVICERECSVYQLLAAHANKVRSLKDACRIVTWRAMGTRFVSGVGTLPIPEPIKEYLLTIV